MLLLLYFSDPSSTVMKPDANEEICSAFMPIRCAEPPLYLLAFLNCCRSLGVIDMQWSAPHDASIVNPISALNLFDNDIRQLVLMNSGYSAGIGRSQIDASCRTAERPSNPHLRG